MSHAPVDPARAFALLRSRRTKTGAPDYEAVAEEVGVSSRTLRRWVKREGADLTPDPTEEPPTPRTESREDYLRRTLKGVEGDVESARESCSWQAVAALHRLAMATRKELDEEVRANSKTDGPMTAEEADREVESAAREMPIRRLQLAVDVFIEREHLPPLSEQMAAWREIHKPRLDVIDGGRD